MIAPAGGEREAGHRAAAPGCARRGDGGGHDDRGDPACWAYRVCQQCGQFSEAERPRTCESCGAAFPVT